MTSLVMPICLYCTHYDRNVPRDGSFCSAFPDGIPVGIIDSQVDHREPVEGDHGIQFDPDCARGAAYAAELFGDDQKDESTLDDDRVEVA